MLAAVKANQAFLAGVPLVSFQNGVRSDALVATVLPAQQLVSAVVNIHANYLAPGTVTLLYPGPLVIGRPFGSNDDRVEAIAAILVEMVHQVERTGQFWPVGALRAAIGAAAGPAGAVARQR